jgi:hypothetical protein
MFLSEYATPASLQMTQVTQRIGSSHQLGESAYTLALSTAKPFHLARVQGPKLNRQWSAYLQHAGGLLGAEDIASILTQLNWYNISNVPDAHIVEVSANYSILSPW